MKFLPGSCSRWLIPLASVLVTLPAAHTAAPAGRPPVAPPNIIVLLADDMGYGDPRCYNPASKIPTPNMDRIAAEGWSDEAIGPTLTEKALGFITASAAARKPFFLYFASQAPHRNCTPPDFARGKSQAGVRGDMVYEFDWSVGRVLAKLEELGIANNTLVIVTSDNGAVPKSDEGEDFGHKSNGDLRGTKGGLFEGGHRVPFLVRWPGQAPAGKTNTSLVVLTDLMATFASLVGARLPAGAGPDSFNVLPALRGTAMDASARPAVVLHSGGGQFALRHGPWKLIFDSKLKPVQLFNLERDLHEETNVIASEPELVARLQAELSQIRDARS